MKNQLEAHQQQARRATDLAGALTILLGGLVGVSIATGLCAAIWGHSVIDRAGGLNILPEHPAFWLFPFFLLAGLVVGFAGMVVLLYLPVCFRRSVEVQCAYGPVGSASLLRWMLRYSQSLTAYCNRELARREAAEPPSHGTLSSPSAS